MLTLKASVFCISEQFQALLQWCQFSFQVKLEIGMKKEKEKMQVYHFISFAVFLKAFLFSWSFTCHKNQTRKQNVSQVAGWVGS